MELLDRYLLQIERYLPQKDRKDTLEELKNLLLEDLDSRVSNGEPEGNALYNVIKEFGAPKDVALKYRNDAPIISREMEPILYLVLKIVVIAVPFAILLASSISFLSNGLPFNFIDFLLNILFTIPQMISAALAGVGSTFIIFVLIERYAKAEIIKEFEDEFEPRHLPKVPDSVFKVSLVESLFVITMGIVFLYIINYQQGLIAVYYDGSSFPLLNENFTRILPVMNVNVAFSIIIEIIHTFKRRKTMVTTTLELMNKILTSIVFVLLASGSILNVVILEGYHLEVLAVLFVIGMSIGAAANFIGGIVVYVKVIIAASGKKEVLKDLINKQK